MKISSLVLLATWTTTTAFQGTNLPSHRDSRVTRYGYIPDGFTKESYAKFKAQEAKKNQATKNLGRMGPKGFQSRSFQSFQEVRSIQLLVLFNLIYDGEINHRICTAVFTQSLLTAFFVVRHWKEEKRVILCPNLMRRKGLRKAS